MKSRVQMEEKNYCMILLSKRKKHYYYDIETRDGAEKSYVDN